MLYHLVFLASFVPTLDVFSHEGNNEVEPRHTLDRKMTDFDFVGRIVLAVAVASIPFPDSVSCTTCFDCPDVLHPSHCQLTTECNQDQMCFTHLGPYGADSDFRYTLSCASKMVCDSLSKLQSQYLGNNALCSECCSTEKCNKDGCINNVSSKRPTITTTTPQPTTIKTTHQPQPPTHKTTRQPHLPTHKTTTHKPYVRPTATMHQHHLNLISGDYVRIYCYVSGYPTPTIHWLYNGREISRSHHYSISKSHGHSYLRIYHTAVSDSGQYTCRADNVLGSSTANVTMNVTHGERPHITHAPQSITVGEGQQFTLTCRASGNPTPSIRWTYSIKDHDAHDISRLISQNTKHDQLTVHHASALVEGVYTCTATNKLGSTSSQATVRIIQPTTVSSTTTAITTPLPMHTVNAQLKPVVTLFPHHSVEYGGTITLHCNVTGASPLRVTWKQIPGSFPANVHQSGRDLIITHAQPFNHKLYQCVVANAHGFGSGLIDVSVKGTKPVIFESPLSQTIYQGTSASLTCNCSGYPLPAIAWTRIDKTQGHVEFTDLLKDNHISVNSNNTTLTINNATLAQSGHFTCTCTNENGHATVDSQLTVLPLKKPHILSTQEYFSTNYGSSAVIPCRVEGSPTPTLEWKFNQSPIRASNVKVGNMSITITSATPTNAGTYKCIASNMAGQNSSDFILSVVGRGPSFTSSPPSFVNVIFGHSHDFTCTASGIPPPKITWTFKSAHGISTFPSGSHINQDNTRITVQNLRDFGVVTCIAENVYGRTTTQTSVYVKTVGLVG